MDVQVPTAVLLELTRQSPHVSVMSVESSCIVIIPSHPVGAPVAAAQLISTVTSSVASISVPEPDTDGFIVIVTASASTAVC